MPTTYLTKNEYSQAKAALTRAQKKGPEAVAAEVAKRFRIWNDNGVAYPDDWHRWQRALEDAAYELRRQGYDARITYSFDVV